MTIKKNKKGFLLAEETLKIVVAVISIGFLIYFLTSLYFAKVNEAEKKKAEASLNRIKEIINHLTNENSELFKSESFKIPNPSGWHLFSFVQGEKIPNSCANENCLCICEAVRFDNFLIIKDGQIKECDNNGVCSISKNIKGFESIEIGKDGTDILISKNEDVIEITKK